jgi:3-hydroxybutyryl-CoA dehydrogenase
VTTVNHIGVIGGGIMGSAIGQALLQHGYEVTIRDIEEEVLDEARERVVYGNYGLERAVEDGHLSGTEKDEALSRLELTLDMETAVDKADLVIEAAPENLALKGELFRQLDAATAGIPLYTRW